MTHMRETYEFLLFLIPYLAGSVGASSRCALLKHTAQSRVAFHEAAIRLASSRQARSHQVKRKVELRLGLRRCRTNLKITPQLMHDD